MEVMNPPNNGAQTSAGSPLNVSYWTECIQKWYPELDKRTYFLPPLHFNRVPYDEVNVAGQSILVPLVPDGGAGQPAASQARGRSQPRSRARQASSRFLTHVQDSDMRDDQAMARVLHSLRALAENSNPKEVMMVISQLKFGQYLNKPAYAAAAALCPRPVTLPQNPQGDFDVLIIHKEHGLITGEIKSVGENFSSLKLGEKIENNEVVEKVKAAIKQLNKAEYVLKHLVSDFQDVKITKILMMPNLTSNRLLRAITSNVNVAEELCRCLGVKNPTTAVQHCLCANQLPPPTTPWKTSKAMLEKLRKWWHLAVVHGSQRTVPSHYLQIVARFCGPATTVEISCASSPRLELRTEGESVSETGMRMARLILLQKQIEILTRSPDRLFIVGPPGTGKTVVLMLQGLRWMQQQQHIIYIISTWSESHAVANLLQHQLLEISKKWYPSIHTSTSPSRFLSRHNYDFNKMDGGIEKAIKNISDLMQKERTEQLCILADDVGPEHGDTRRFTQFCDQLIQAFPTMWMWATATSHVIKPPYFTEFIMAIPIRSPPVVVREVEKAQELKEGLVYPYSPSQTPVETDGPPVIRLRHSSGKLGHTEGIPEECETCGKEVARILHENLRIGQCDNYTLSNSPPPLQYRDVMVLCGYPRDDGEGLNGYQTTAIGLVRGLRACNVPVCVVSLGLSDQDLDQLALPQSNAVTVTSSTNVRGLERKVVVMSCFDMNSWYDTLHGASRCQAQLVWIDSS